MTGCPGFRLTQKAQEDLIEIWVFIAQDDPSAADRHLDRLEEICGLLADSPRIGPARDDIREGMRYFVVDEYLIFYRIVDESIEVVRVLHGRREIQDLI